MPEVKTLEKRPAHRPEVITDDIVKQIAQLHKTLTFKDSCAALGHSDHGVSAYLKRHPHLRLYVTRAKLMFRSELIAKMLDPADDKAASARVKGISFFLSGTDERFKTKATVEHEHRHQHIVTFDPHAFDDLKRLAGNENIPMVAADYRVGEDNAPGDSSA